MNDVSCYAANKPRARVTFSTNLARWLLSRKQARDTAAVATDWTTYGEWRDYALHDQFTEFFGVGSAHDKDVLDFGCGDGQLCIQLARVGARSVHGVDISEPGLKRFDERLRAYTGRVRPTYTLSREPRVIDAADQSFDAIYCLDALEHIMDYEAIIHEWHRVLRPGGSVYIWWQPYWHPYGHHAQYWAPTIPWLHVLLTHDEINRVCEAIVDWPDFNAPVWDRNVDGTKKNRFRGLNGNAGFLNELTVGEFEHRCAEAKLHIVRREFRPFNVPQPLKLVSTILSRVPMLQDYFIACAVYRLQKWEHLGC
jgi:ubiquinone/menaquinone biosynthesis C-methylase UbiE